MTDNEIKAHYDEINELYDQINYLKDQRAYWKDRALAAEKCIEINLVGSVSEQSKAFDDLEKLKNNEPK